MKARIKTPLKGYNGVSVGVTFTDGFAEAEINDSQLNYFKRRGYFVTLLEMPRFEIEEKPKSSQKKASPKSRSGKRSKKC